MLHFWVVSSFRIYMQKTDTVGYTEKSGRSKMKSLHKELLYFPHEDVCVQLVLFNVDLMWLMGIDMTETVQVKRLS